jgi:hypothetical protein
MVVDGRWFDSVKAFCQTFDENSGNQFFVSATWLIFAFIARWHGRTWVWVKNGRGQEWSKMNVWMVKICENHDKPWGFMRLRFRNFETTFFFLGNCGNGVLWQTGKPLGKPRCVCWRGWSSWDSNWWKLSLCLWPLHRCHLSVVYCLTYQSGIIWVTFWW